jgi:hypothetical protein
MRDEMRGTCERSLRSLCQACSRNNKHCANLRESGSEEWSGRGREGGRGDRPFDSLEDEHVAVPQSLQQTAASVGWSE